MAAVSDKSFPLDKFDLHYQLIEDIREGTYLSRTDENFYGLPRESAYIVSEYCDNIAETDKVRGLAYRVTKGKDERIVIGTTHFSTIKIAQVLNLKYHPLFARVSKVFVEIDKRKFPLLGQLANQKILELVNNLFNIPLDEFVIGQTLVLTSVRLIKNLGDIPLDNGDLTKAKLQSIAGFICTGMFHYLNCLGQEISHNYGHESSVIVPLADRFGKEVDSLETVKTQLEATALTIETMAKNCFNCSSLNDLVAGLTNIPIQLTRKLVEAVGKGDLAAVTNVVFPSENETSFSIHKTICDRNPAMVKAFLQGPASSLAAIGVIHLCDDPSNSKIKGVLSLLRDEGFSVEQL